MELVRMAGGVVVPLYTKAEDGFQIDLSELKSRIGPRTRAILLSSPSNPTGVVQSAQTLAGIAEIVARQKNPELFVITDDLYRRLVYAPAAWHSLLHFAPELLPQVILVDGVSKAYAMTGWRVGFCAAPRHVIDAIERLQGQVTTNATAVAQYAALAALRGDQQPVELMREEFDRRRRFMHKKLQEIPELRCAEPQGAFYCLPDLGAYLRKDSRDSALPSSDVELADWLLTHAHVAVVPGAGFLASGYLRLSYATSMSRIEEGLRRIAAGLSELRAA
jgi:aspartate aminotransferase